MNLSIRNGMLCLSVLLLTTIYTPAIASHIVGGDVTYIYQGDSTDGITVYHKYQVTLCIYEDSLNGNPQALVEDNPAILAAYDGTGATFSVDNNVPFSSATFIPITSAPSPCGALPDPYPTLLVRKTFVKTYYFPDNASGYVVANQRCCRNAAILNIVTPGNDGATYFCKIPAAPILNTSAVFKNYPPQIICYNMPLFYDNSATDADGDSLSYGFSAALNGANGADIKPIALPPPYDSIVYLPGFSSQVPFTGSPAIAIDPVTGVITGTPDHKGRYLVAVSCYEWRGGAIINTMTREYEFIVHDCRSLDYHPIAGLDTTIMTGDSIQFNAMNGTNYLWTPATYLTDSAIGNPVGHYPVAGAFVYNLYAVSDSGCSGNTSRTVFVIDHAEYTAPNGFTPNGDGLNDHLKPLAVLNATLVDFKVYNRNSKLIYTGGASEAGWDGTYNGVQQPVGTYIWVVTYKDNNGVTRSAKGNVTLIR